MRARAFANLSAGVVWITGCASSPHAPPQQAPAPTATGAQQAAAEPTPERPAAEADTSAPPVSAPAGPAKITVDARVHGQSAAADVRLIGPGGEEVAHGSTGEALQATSGDYEMQVTIRDAGALADKPTQRRSLTLSRGDDLHEKVDFPWAMIQLNVVVNGSPDSSAVVHLMRGDAEVAAFKSGAPPAAISPGRYRAQVKTRGAAIDVPQVMFPDSATQSIPVRVQM
jgi:hypothetical protein